MLLSSWKEEALTRKSLTRILSFGFLTLRDENMSKEAIQRRFREVEEALAMVKQIQKEFMNCKEDQTWHIISHAEEKVREYENFLEGLCYEQNPTVTAKETSLITDRLAKESIPMFRGQPDKFESFWAEVEDFMVNDKNLSGGAKLRYLEGTLQNKEDQALVMDIDKKNPYLEEAERRFFEKYPLALAHKFNRNNHHSRLVDASTQTTTEDLINYINGVKKEIINRFFTDFRDQVYFYTFESSVIMVLTIVIILIFIFEYFGFNSEANTVLAE